MADYISREAAEQVFTNARRALFRNVESYSQIEFDIRDNVLLNAQQIIHTLPAADIAPVVHGEWEIVKLPPDPGYKAKECSVCKCNFWDLEEWDYCPNCGSRMDGGDGDG